LIAAPEEEFVLVCALASEERSARRAKARVARVGLGARLPLPAGRLVSFGLAGALVPGLEPGTLVSAERIVDGEGTTLWEGRALPVPGARAGALCAVDRVIDDAREREALAARTGALAVDMESGRLAASGRLTGAVRAISDTASRPVGLLARAAKPNGGVDLPAVLQAFATEPLTAFRAARGAGRAFSALERAAVALRQGPQAGGPAH
jgi:adenosylhomocysteine nucleosidase